MSKHTPTPYRQNGLTVETKNGMSLRIATISPPGAIHGYAAKTLDESNANAEFIVTACNAYDGNQQAIAELMAAMDQIKTIASTVSDPADAANTCMDIARNALKKVGK